MFRRKLLALNHPNPNEFNVEDINEFRNMVVWLEDQKIRQYKIEDRAALRDTSNPEWQRAYDADRKHFGKRRKCWLPAMLVTLRKKPIENIVEKGENYLQELGCPYQNTDNKEIFDWILGYAVRLEYGDDVEKFKAVNPQTFSTSSNQAPQGKSSNPLDNLDFNDPDFKAGITSLAMLLQIPPYHDHLEQLKAICILVHDKLSKEVLERAEKNQSKNEFIPIDKTELGFDTGDYIINEAAKILRLLHIRDLRELQTQINQAIVAVQTITANPKTDSRLGKVGR